MKKLNVVLAVGAIAPKRNSEGAAGFDLYALEDCEVPATTIYGRAASVGRYKVSTGVHMEIPSGYQGKISPRSGLAFNEGIECHPGTIDSDYRGEVKVLIYNYLHKPYQIRKGDRIAQIVFSKIETPEIVLSESLSDTARGEGGFGHTGV